jgi:hypothetical protein
MSNRAPERIAAAAAGLVVAGVAVVGAAYVAFSVALAGEAPDPYAPDGDPCCGHPDTWGEVASGAVWTLAIAVVVSLLAGCALALLCFAARRRWPRGRAVQLLPATIVGGTAVGLAVMIVPNLGEGRARIDCDTYTFDRAAWASGGVARADQARALDRCDALVGRTPAQVRALLGAPPHEGPALENRRWWGYDGLDVEFEDGRVARVGASAADD